jgi:Flp pilus assembly protein TadB
MMAAAVNELVFALSFAGVREELSESIVRIVAAHVLGGSLAVPLFSRHFSRHEGRPVRVDRDRDRATRHPRRVMIELVAVIGVILALVWVLTGTLQTLGVLVAFLLGVQVALGFELLKKQPAEDAP